MFVRNDDLYDTLKKKVTEHEGFAAMTFRQMFDAISDDHNVRWNDIRVFETANNPDWNNIKANWKYKITQALVTPGRFVIGGDRTSATARGAKQCALLEYTRELALQRPLEDDDHAVSDDVVDAVAVRFRGTTTDATMQLRRNVRRVTRRVRVRQRNPGAAANDSDDDEEVLLEEHIQEVIVRPATSIHPVVATPPSLMTYIDPHALGGLPLEVLDRLVKLRHIDTELVLESKRIEAALETQRIDAALETQRINAPAELVRAQTEQLKATAQQPRAAVKGKRARTADDTAAAELDRVVAATWRNMRSLPAAVLLVVPLGVTVPPTRELCAAVLAWARSSAAARVKHRARFAPRIVPELEVVYIDINEDHAALARRFWADRAAAAFTTITSTEVAATGCDSVAPPPSSQPAAIGASLSDGAPSSPATAAAAVPPPRMLYDRAVVLRDIATMQGCGALPAHIASALVADAGLPYFAADPPDAPWKANRCEMRALRSLYGLDSPRLSDADNGAIVTIAKRLPGWDTTWMERRCSGKGRSLPMRYAAGAAMGHLKRAAELLAALRADGLFATPAEASDAVAAMVERLMR